MSLTVVLLYHFIMKDEVSSWSLNYGRVGLFFGAMRNESSGEDRLYITFVPISVSIHTLRAVVGR